ncbi:MAG: TniQ family protein [Burkholderiales bacterium]|nr:TniQ family protein [Burkholderiales bacterium]
MTAQPFDGELLGSFLVRCAWQQGDAPSSMAQRIGLGWSIWSSDLDRSIGSAAIGQIAKWADLDTTQVEAMTVLPMLAAAGLTTQRSGFQRWLNPVGIYHRKRLRYGQLYCPVCLSADARQLPLEWRLASTWICSVHLIALRDSCPHCDAPFAPYRRDALMTACCDRCTIPLYRGRIERPSREEQVLQMRVRSVWHRASNGEPEMLDGFHAALSNAAQRDPTFAPSVEPWSYWRLAQRRPLLVTVGASTLVRATAGPAVQAIRRVVKEGRRRCAKLPRNRVLRAEMLIRLAAKVKFPRRAKARLAKTA